MPDEPKRPTPQASVLTQITIPNHYFNGFELGHSLSDMSALILLDGQPQARLSMSFTTAKTLAENLSQVVKTFEQTTHHDIMTMDDVQASMKDASKSS
jgi:hypothetical protein